MDVKFVDYNDAGNVIAATESEAWKELAGVIGGMRLHLKASDQAKKVGTNIFDPVGTNAYFWHELADKRQWRGKLPLPKKFQFLGTDIDFGKGGLLLEVQFSNYPFLLNNLLRAELLYKQRDTIVLTDRKIEAVVILTKAGMFPASNSTLYYEQAQKQLDALAEQRVFTVPLRLAGLFAPLGQPIVATKTTYKTPRYSRAPIAVEDETVTYDRRVTPALEVVPDPENATKDQLGE
jgi:hypothetical protein